MGETTVANLHLEYPFNSTRLCLRSVLTLSCRILTGSLFKEYVIRNKQTLSIQTVSEKTIQWNFHPQEKIEA